MHRWTAVVGLVLVSVGTGGIKPCVCAFGGDQFRLPEQQAQLGRFFGQFVTVIYVGALISTFAMPELRKNVQCFGRDTCYPLAFGVLSACMITAIGRALLPTVRSTARGDGGRVFPVRPPPVCS